jgi:tRNA threonylcarbamoyladenosine biosynthesis protein TsaE
MISPKIIYTSDVSETEAAGASLAEQILATPTLPSFVALYGDLGVGKTAFVRGFASVIAPEALVRSPTFALVNEYRGKGQKLFHFDMYRIESEDDLASIGFDDYLRRDGYAVSEWSENIESELPSDAVRVLIERTDAFDGRAITLPFEV